MPYTERSRQNLLREGIPGQRIFVTGNPIYEVIRHYDSQIRASAILQNLGLASAQYFLVTLHRAENVDIEERLHSNENFPLQVVDELRKLGHDVLTVQESGG